MRNLRRILCIAPLLLVAAASAVAAQDPTPRPPRFTVLATVPDPPRAAVGRSTTFYIRYRLDTQEPLLVSIDAYGQGQRLSTGNSGLTAIPAGGGTGVSFFFLLSGHRQVVDEVRLVASTTDQPQRRWTFSVPVALTFDPAVTGTKLPVPDWLKSWRAERAAATRAATRQPATGPAGSRGTLVGLTLLIALLVLGLPLASIALPIWAIWTWKGRWRLMACLPLAVIGLKLVSVGVGIARDPTSHNLWPLEIALWEAPALGFLTLVWLARRTAVRADGNGPGA